MNSIKKRRIIANVLFLGILSNVAMFHLAHNRGKEISEKIDNIAWGIIPDKPKMEGEEEELFEEELTNKKENSMRLTRIKRGRRSRKAQDYIRNYDEF